MDSYVEQFQAAGGSMVMLAKGNRSKVVTEACHAHGGFYLGSIGGPAARLAQDCIKVVSVLEYEELGMEAVWKIEVEDFPAFIVVDDKGNDFFTDPSGAVTVPLSGIRVARRTGSGRSQVEPSRAPCRWPRQTTDRSACMQCPNDGATLTMSERSGIEIDYCPTCRGVWLDRGELDKIIERSLAQPAPHRPRRSRSSSRSPCSRNRPQPQVRPAGLQQRPYKKKRKESWLSELFD